jgi:hypothetical protein
MAAKGFERREYKNGGHGYYYEGKRVPGVTTIIGKSLPKHLEYWSAELVAIHAHEHPEHFPSVPLSGLRSAARAIFESARNDAAERGKQIHALAEAVNRGEAVSVPPEHDGALLTYERWFSDFAVATMYAEAAIFSATYRYAGTIDLMAIIDGGPLVLIDLKTGNSGVWPETCLQLAAYRNAEWIQPRPGAPLEPMPRVDLCAALWLQADRYEFIPLEAGAREFAVFLHAMEIAGWGGLPRDALVGQPMLPSTEGVA